MAYLGIDLGTGGIRCVLIRVDGSVIVEVSRSLPCLNRSSKAGESEHADHRGAAKADHQGGDP